MIQITAPDQSPFDESIAISVSGLLPKQHITIRVDATRNDVTMSSFANYEASKNGDIDLTRDKSLGGTYFGKEPMGLFWSMELTSKSVIAFKMVVGHLEFWPYSIQIYDGYANNFKELNNQKPPLAERTIKRMFLNDGVRRSDVRYQTLRGFLFLPNPDTVPGPYPAVIDIFGSTNLLAHRAALLARYGYAVLAVAFGGYDDLPTEGDVIDIGYFGQAIDVLKNHSEIDGNRIGAIGNCVGATLVLAVAREYPEIRAIAATSPEPIAEEIDYSFPKSGDYVKCVKLVVEPYEVDGRPFKRISQEKSVIQAGGSLDSWRQFCLNFGQIKDAPVLMFYGAGDTFFDLNFVIPRIREQFATGKKENYEIVFYKGASHIFQPRFMPVNRCYYSPLFQGMVCYGGEISDHAKAQDDMWNRVLTFFKSHLKEAHADDYNSGHPRPVNVRRSDDGKIADGLNCQFNVVDFEDRHSSFLM